MSNYTLPYEFVPGTKASAEEVNTNFKKIVDILNSIGVARYPFCVNYGSRDESGKEYLLSHDGEKVTSRTGSNFAEFAYTTGAAVPTPVTKPMEVAPEPTLYAQIIPAMSSALEDTVTCAASSEEEGHEAWHAFDKNEDTFWGSFVGVTSATLAVTLNEQCIIDYYFIKTLTPLTWTLEASNDENVWTVLDEYSAAEASTITRPVRTKGNFNSYRLVVTVLGDSYQVQIAEFDLYRKSESGSLQFEEKQILYIGSSQLLSLNNKFFRQELEPVPMAKYSSIIPEMKSNMVPDGYHVSASSYSAMNAPYLATDQKETTFWEATSGLNEVWFQVQLPNPIAAKVCKLTLRSDDKAVDQALLNGKLLASNNGITWVELYTFKDLSWNFSSESRYFYFTSNVTKFSYYKLVGDPPFASLGEFQLYQEDEAGEHILGEADVNDVWFKCAEPYAGRIYKGSMGWQNFDCVPAGEVYLDNTGSIVGVITYPYNQNGYNINAMTTKKDSGNIVTYDSYISHFGSSGYVILPNGLILQWGQVVGREYVLFPASFPHSVLTVIASPLSSDSTAQVVVSSANKSRFKLVNSNSDSSLAENVQNYWFALGW